MYHLSHEDISNETVMETKAPCRTPEKPGAGSVHRGVSEPLAAYAFEPYVSLFQATPEDRVRLIRQGVKAVALVDTSKAMGIPRERLFVTLNLPAGTVKRKIAQDELLPPDQSERIIGLQKLIGQVETMVAESGDPEGFDPAKWVAGWLDTPCQALGGDRPADYMDTIEGQRIVSELLGRMQSGAYA